MLFKRDAEKQFDVKSIISPEMDSHVSQWGKAYQGAPSWVDDYTKTVNMAKTICSETARLTTLAVKVTVDGSGMADWLQGRVDQYYYKLREWVEYACGFGTVILKPNGPGIDLFTPADFIVTSTDDDGQINGIIFIDHYAASENGERRFYTRYEYHRCEGNNYLISNRAFVSKNDDSLGDPIALEATVWHDLLEEASVAKRSGEQIDGPLFAVLKTPMANNVDVSSPLGMAAFAEALEELRDLDVAYSRNATEIEDSSRTVLIDSDRLMPTGTKVPRTGDELAAYVEKMQLPRYVKTVFGSGGDDIYHEINPTLNTEQRMVGINALLSQIGYKCGFSNGYFVFNEKTGMVTATQVESDDRRTLQTIKDYRDQLQLCIDQLLYALSVMANLYGYAPAGEWETTYDFQDLTENWDEDRARWWGYVQAGKVPAWMFFVKYEGMSEKDAKAMVEEAAPKEPTLFGEE